MKNSKWPSKYFHTPHSDKKITEIWDDIDNYTFEEQFEQEERKNKIDFVVPLPPFKYKGKFLKGMFYSQAVDIIVDKYPKIKELFFPIANSMFCSYPGSTTADAFMVCYDNKKREKHWKNKHPDRKDVIMLPLQDADFLNEYIMAPAFNVSKKIDIFCVSTAYPVKNIPMIASALKIYETKYRRRLKVVYALGSRIAKRNSDGTLDYSKERFDVVAELDKIKKILGGDIKKYIDFYPYIEYADLPKYYTSAKCSVLASLMEGKNRFISEAMSCDTPVIVFRDFNKYVRGDHPVFFANSGEYVEEFTPDSLADTIHKVITNYKDYEPRKNYLTYSGRKNFLNTCVDLIPYYRKNLEGYEKGNAFNNVWLDLAMQDNYKLGLYDFLYSRNPAIQHVRGLKNIDNLVNFFFERFGM